MMIERKIVISGCGNCPYKQFNVGSIFYSPRYVCGKYDFTIDSNFTSNTEETDPRCLLPINIKSKHIK